MIRLIAAVLLALPSAISVAAQAPAASALPQMAPENLTDAVAQAFTEARAQAHLRRLTRIPDRPLLRRIVCSAAATGASQGLLLAKESQADGAIFAISDPAHLPADLKRVAEYDDRASARGRRVTRFSVAAFTSITDPSMTWVGIALYWSRFTEYFVIHLTRSYYPPNLATDLAPICRTLR